MKTIRTGLFWESLKGFNSEVVLKNDKAIESLLETRNYSQMISSKQVRFMSDSNVWRLGVSGAYRLVYLVESTPKKPIFVVLIGLYTHAKYDILWKEKGQKRLCQLAREALEDNEVKRHLVELKGEPDKVSLIPARAIGLRLPLVDLVSTQHADRVTETRDATLEIISMQNENPVLFDELANLLICTTNEINGEHRFGNLLVESRVAGGERVTNLFDSRSSNDLQTREYQRPKSVELWQRMIAASVSNVDPFLKLDEDQCKILNKFQEFDSLPIFIDGPGGSGKTTLMLEVLRSILANRRYYENVSAKILSLNQGHVNSLRSAISNFLELSIGLSATDAKESALSTAMTIDEYLLVSVPEDKRNGFLMSKKLRWSHFCQWRRNQRIERKDSAQLWTALRVLILGDVLSREEDAGQDTLLLWFDSLREERRHDVSTKTFEAAISLLPRYEEWKKTTGFWDERDLVAVVHEEIDKDTQQRNLADIIMVDEAQDLTPDQIRILLRSASFVNYELERDSSQTHEVPLPFLFAADDLQTVNPSGFRWKFFQAIFYEETRRLLNSPRGIDKERQSLLKNYRMLGGPLKIATGLRKWIEPQPENVYAASDGGFAGPWEGHVQEEAQLFKHADVILLPEHLTSDEINKFIDNDECLRVNLPGKFDRNKVLSAHDAKGQEWSFVLLYRFAEYCQAEQVLGVSRYTKQVTYVAGSRARDVCVWFDSSNSKEWFWNNVSDPLSPAAKLIGYTPISRLPDLANSKSTSDYRRDALRRINNCLKNNDNSHDELIAELRYASYEFNRAEDPECAQFVQEASDLVSQKRKTLAIDRAPKDLAVFACKLAFRYESWTSFAGLRHETLEINGFGLIGSSIYEFNSGNTTEALKAFSKLDLETLIDAVELNADISETLFTNCLYAVIEEMRLNRPSAMQGFVQKPVLELIKEGTGLLYNGELTTAVVSVEMFITEKKSEALIKLSGLAYDSAFRTTVATALIGQELGVEDFHSEVPLIFPIRNGAEDECDLWLQETSKRFSASSTIKENFCSMQPKQVRRLSTEQLLRLMIGALEFEQQGGR